MKFILENLEPGLILSGRNESSVYGKAIRACLGSYTNHNGLFIKDENIGWCIGEAIQPVSCLTPLVDYERLMNEEGYVVRVWRVKDAASDSRRFVAYYFRSHLLGLRYPGVSIAKLAIFRLVNNLPWKLRIKGVFCTELVQMAWAQTVSEPFRKPDGRAKKNPTPRTTENRLVQGVLEDVTDRMITK